MITSRFVRARRVVTATLVVSALVAFVPTAPVDAQESVSPDTVSGADANEGGPGFVQPASQITAGYDHTCARLDDGTVRCWGSASSGQLGYGNTDKIGDNETPGSVGPVNLGAGRTATAITTGANHTCALLDNGTVRCWGPSLEGQLGYGNTDTIGDNETPAAVGPVNLGAGRTATAITTGGAHTCALLDDASVRCWGFGGNGQLGYGNTADIGDNETPASVGPVNLGAGRTATAISAGDIHTCALLDDGTVRCWGYGMFGALGYGNTADIGDNETPGSVGPVNLGAGRTATAVTAGSTHTCALLDNGTVRCWGNGGNGRLGYGNTDTIGDNETPGSVGPVNLGGGRTAAAVTAGGAHTCALLDNGTVRCWGNGFSGQLGYGNTDTIGDNETPATAGPVDLGAGRTVLVDNDSDEVATTADNCPFDANPNQSDVDGDGLGDVCDPRDDRSNRIFVTNVIQSGPAEYDFLFGKAFEEIFTGDWNGNGRDGFARRDGRTIVEVDERGNPIRTIVYGAPTDTLYRVGDWNGDNTDTFAVQRGNIFYTTDSPTGGPSPAPIGYGRAGDEVFVGDWNGNGQDTFAVRRGNVFYVRNSVTTGVADIVFGYGRRGDEVLIGDWNNDGIDTFAVRRGNIIYIRNDFISGVAQTTIGYGKASDTLLVGDWNGDNIDTFAVQRKE